MANIYFELTREFNRDEPIALLASGQAVVFYRIAMMSKDGDWVIGESPEACERVRAVLAARGARHRPSPPLDVRWLAGGWSSHFEFTDDRARRVRCDFFSRPPRVALARIQEMFGAGGLGPVSRGVPAGTGRRDATVRGPSARVRPCRTVAADGAVGPGGTSCRCSVKTT